MFKKTASLIMIAIFLLSSSLSSFANSDLFEITDLQNGSVKVSSQKSLDKKTKVMIEKNGEKYFYILKNSDVFPLQLGNGEYKITIMENVKNNEYKLVQTKTIKLELSNNTDAFLNSIQLINWSDNMTAIKKAQELTKNASSDKEKAELIYEYIINNISYDYDKANNVQNEYLPSIEKTFSSSKAICFDFASLNASMLRSLDIPTRLVMGYKNDINSYHAWNEVYLDGNWVVIDATYDSILVQNDLAYSMVKNSSDYQVQKIY